MGKKAQLLSRRFSSHPAALVVLGFAIADLLGTIALMLPWMHKRPLSFLDCLFTSTSAVCVTGLSVVNVAQTFTKMGQAVIMLLMQIGGLGVMTFSVFIYFSLGRPVKLSYRVVLQESFLNKAIPDIGRLIGTIFLFTFLVEGISGWLLTMLFSSRMPLGQAIFNGYFHAVSAFCNGGFSTFPDGLVSYRSNWPVCTVIMLGQSGSLNDFWG